MFTTMATTTAFTCPSAGCQAWALAGTLQASVKGLCHLEASGGADRL